MFVKLIMEERNYHRIDDYDWLGWGAELLLPHRNAREIGWCGSQCSGCSAPGKVRETKQTSLFSKAPAAAWSLRLTVVKEETTKTISFPHPFHVLTTAESLKLQGAPTARFSESLFSLSTFPKILFNRHWNMLEFSRKKWFGDELKKAPRFYPESHKVKIRSQSWQDQGWFLNWYIDKRPAPPWWNLFTVHLRNIFL